MFPTFREKEARDNNRKWGWGSVKEKRGGRERKEERRGEAPPHPSRGNTDFSTHTSHSRVRVGVAKSLSWRGRGARKGAKCLISKD